jgi:hypothetical protein
MVFRQSVYGMGGGSGEGPRIPYDVQRSGPRGDRKERSGRSDPSLVPTRKKVGKEAIRRSLSLFLGDGRGEVEGLEKDERPSRGRKTKGKEKEDLRKVLGIYTKLSE